MPEAQSQAVRLGPNPAARQVIAPDGQTKGPCVDLVDCVDIWDMGLSILKWRECEEKIQNFNGSSATKRDAQDTSNAVTVFGVVSRLGRACIACSAGDKRRSATQARKGGNGRERPNY